MDALEKPEIPRTSEIKDLSKKGLVALVLLTVVVSLIGSFLVLNEISRSRVLIHDEKPAIGAVQLGVHYPQAAPEVKPASTGSTGYVALHIDKNPNVLIKKPSILPAEKVQTPRPTEKQQFSSQNQRTASDHSSSSQLYYYEERGVNHGYLE